MPEAGYRSRLSGALDRRLRDGGTLSALIIDLLSEKPDVDAGGRVDLDQSADPEWSEPLESFELNEELGARAHLISVASVAIPLEEAAHGNLRWAATPQLHRPGELFEPVRRRSRRRRELRTAPERHEHGAWELLCLLRERDIGPSAEMRTFSLRISRPVQEVDEHVVLIEERESELVCHR